MGTPNACCSQCDSRNITIYSDGHYRCRECGYWGKSETLDLRINEEEKNKPWR